MNEPTAPTPPISDLVTLVRYSYSFTESGQTLGYIALEPPWYPPTMIYTLEDAWLDNATMRSCIPDGLYTCRPRRFYKGGYDAIEIAGVPGRSTILIHKGNSDEDVSGCIVVGESIGILYDQLAVLNSTEAFRKVMRWLGDRTFRLRIRPACDGIKAAKLGPGMNGWTTEVSA